MANVLTTTKPVKTTSRQSEPLTHEGVVFLIQEEQRLAREALQRKAQRQKGIAAVRTSLQPAGLIFGVTVITKDGEKRVMACKFGVSVGLSPGVRKKPNSKDHGTFKIYEMINSSTNLRRTLKKLADEIADLERRLAAGPTPGRRRQLEKTLARKKAQQAKPVLKPTYREINIEGLQGLRIRGRVFLVTGCSE